MKGATERFLTSDAFMNYHKKEVHKRNTQRCTKENIEGEERWKRNDI